MGNSRRRWNIYIKICTATPSLLATDLCSLSFVYLPFSFTVVAFEGRVAIERGKGGPAGRAVVPLMPGLMADLQRVRRQRAPGAACPGIAAGSWGRLA